MMDLNAKTTCLHNQVGEEISPEMIADNLEAGAVHGKVVGRLVRLLRRLLGRCAPLLVQGALGQVAEFHVGMVGGGVQARHHLDHVVAAWDEAAISRHTAINKFC